MVWSDRHFLLGRPWMYDRKVRHNGFSNTYSFSKGGKKITLVLLAPSELSKPKPQTHPKRWDMLFAYSKPIQKASYHESQTSREWILATQEESELPMPKNLRAKSILKSCFLKRYLLDYPRNGISSITSTLFPVQFFKINQHTEWTQKTFLRFKNKWKSW